MHAKADRQHISFVLSDVQTRPPSGAPPPSARSEAARHRPHPPQPHPPHPPHPPPSSHAPHQEQDYHRHSPVLIDAEVDAYPPPPPAHCYHHYTRCAAPPPPPHHATHVPIFTPPPSLPRRNGPSCVCSLACLALIGCGVFSTLLIIEIPLITLESGVSILQRRRSHAQTIWKEERRRRADGPTTPSIIELGLWDEHLVISPLQLTVALSMATGVDERLVSVDAEGDHFFKARINAERGLVDAINAPESSFLETVNAQAAAFGARMVVAHSAHVRNETRRACGIGSECARRSG